MGTGLGHYIPFLAYLGFWVMCILSLIKEPRYGLYYVMPFLPYRTMRDKLGEYPLAPQLVTLLLVCVVLGAFIKGKKLPPSGLYAVWILFALYLYCSMWLGALMGNAPLPLWLGDANFVAWKDYMILPMVFFASAMVLEERKHIRTALIIFSVAVALVDRSALLESLSHSWAVFDENKRTSGPIEYGPNQLAAFLAQFAMFFWACAHILKRTKVKLIFYVLTGFTMITMIYAFSRAAYVATMIAVGVLALLKDRKLLVLLAVFAVTWQAVVPAAVSERVNMTHNANGKLEASAQERVDRLYQAVGLGMFLVMVSCMALNGFGDRWTYVEINGLLWVLMGATVRVQALVSSGTMQQVPSGLPSSLRPLPGAAIRPAGLASGVR